EYDYWMDRSAAGSGHAVRMADGSILNRYCDQLSEPRPEAFAIDEAVARRVDRPAAEVYRNLRSAAESGWDFSSRWLSDPRRIETIRTTDFIPIDLNCLLYGMERTLARMAEVGGDPDRALGLRRAAEERRAALERYCWAEGSGFFCDYDLRSRAACLRPTLAGLFPLYAGLASPEQARASAEKVAAKFLAPGGLVTSLEASGQQWDWPNGWAPLQWVAVVGLQRYGFAALAETIARRWIQLNRDVYERTGRLMEKYNVVDLTKEAGGGEYPTQDGFAWTNGVLLALLERYPPQRSPA
ncbi:MAG: trehalase family glycosidase, partial [Opitutaceae bacterium]